MAIYEINGGTPLTGSVTISGAKNAAVAILPAALLIPGSCRIENVPDISDVRILLDILAGMGAKVQKPEPGVVMLDCSDINVTTPEPTLVKKLRASYYLMGALLGRFGQSHVALPGGCSFASRPIDQHIKGFKALGAKVIEGEDFVSMEPGDNGLNGNRVSLDVVSVGATVNIMIAAALIPGRTIIENAAKEPHIVDLANFLNTMGADISGAGTDTVKIRGVEALQGGTYTIIPDQIEAGTYIAAVAAVGGDVLVKNVIPKHMECITTKLQEMGAKV
ncbi:MAG: UDP-N-acetylglucosamine 1-carboxyvinyltransferase, partial [Oscillospiraceae bacterium]|nr:UDP-N-acetylglucosamine 1-carboxyvinyltransferase [Oscillospiraceae bacterium]